MGFDWFRDLNRSLTDLFRRTLNLTTHRSDGKNDSSLCQWCDLAKDHANQRQQVEIKVQHFARSSSTFQF